MKKYTLLAAILLASALSAEEMVVSPAPATPRVNNNTEGSAYGASEVQTHLRVDVKDDTNAVRFIRDNNAPFVVTKAFPLKHADAYEIRGYIVAAISGKQFSSSPVTVDAIKFYDGSSMLIVSAEAYRFEENGKGESIGSIISRLDKKGFPYSSGKPKFIYYPKANTAANLKKMLLNVGAAKGSSVDFSNGIDAIVVDGQLNALVFALPYWSWNSVKTILGEYDKPLPEVRVSYKLVEVDRENDDKFGIDFQNWKNNDGVDLLSVGGRYRNNWASTFGAAGPAHTGSNKTEYFNVNPKWNTKYLDFLTSTGRAKVLTHGMLLARNRKLSTVNVASGLFYDNVSENVAGTTINARIVPGDETAPVDMMVQRGKKLETAAADGFEFNLILDPVVTGAGATLALDLSSSSLIGWNSDGSPRLNRSSFKTDVQVGYDGGEFVVGGIRKVSVVRGVAGLPFLKDLPFLGWLFSTESESTKTTDLVLILQTEYVNPVDAVPEQIRHDVGKIVEDVQHGINSPVNNLGFEQIGLDRK
ncbi:MAG: hypothetical protein J6S98_09955 [Lentisphaeria bacterium]|nr:hypothetical protein [Lentisphaeria bacterium]